MLTINEIVEKLYRQPEKFKGYMKNGEYCRAKWCYIETVFVAGFIEMDQEVLDRLFLQFPEKKVKETFRKAGGLNDTGCRPKEKADTAGGYF